MLTLTELAKLGAQAQIEMVREGRVRMRHVFVAFKGAADYLGAIARGRIVTARIAQRRASICAECPGATRRPADKAVGGLARQRVVTDTIWCGRPDEPGERGPDGGAAEGGGPVCGCFVALTVGGVETSVQPGPKAWVERQSGGVCPRGKW